MEVAKAAVAARRGGVGPVEPVEPLEPWHWSFHEDAFWCTARPPRHSPRAHGWKIHVSASAENAGAVLGVVAAVAAADPCAFRFAAGTDQLHTINSRQADRSSSGKFIVLFPDDDHHFCRMVHELHAATAGLSGPAVLSDRPFRPGSPVHYRYGAFAERPVLGNDGHYRSLLTGPGGEQWEEGRSLTLRPPWASEPPLAAAPGTTAAAEDEPRWPPGSGTGPDWPPESTWGPGSTRGWAGSGWAGLHSASAMALLGRDYALTGALRQGADGGLYSAQDVTNGAEVLVKQARALVEVDGSGRDAVAALRAEARMLRRLAGTGLVPRVIDLLEERGQALLVTERFPGQSLSAWVSARLTRDGAPDVRWEQAGPLALALVDLIQRVHAAGVVVRDLSPEAVLVRPDGSLRLIGLELAGATGAATPCGGTPGYQPPEALTGTGRRRRLGGEGPAAPAGSAASPGGIGPGFESGIGPGAGPGPGAESPSGRGRWLYAVRDGELPPGCVPADPAADLFALGGLFFLLATGHDPVLPDDFPSGCRPSEHRLARWLALAARDGETARILAPVINALRAQSPADRPSAERVRDVLARAPHPKAQPQEAQPSKAQPSKAQLSKAQLSKALGQTMIDVTSAAPGSAVRTVPPVRVQPVSAASAAAAASAATVRTEVERMLCDGIGDLAARMAPERPDCLWPPAAAAPLPTADPCNVQEGAAGVLAVLVRAAQTDGLPGGVRELARDSAGVAAEWIVRRMAREPVLLPGLHCGRSGTAWALLDTADLLGDELLAANAGTLASSVPLRWPNPDVCHGAAGAGMLQLRTPPSAFGLSSATELGTRGDDPGAERLRRVRNCADGLLDTARQSPYGLLWPVPRGFDSGLAGATRLGYAHGVAGIGAFLLAAGEATGEQAYLDAAVRAGQTLAATARLEDGAAWWPQSPGESPRLRLAHWCGGSSGVGTFLIRLWRVTGEEAVRELAFAAGEAVLRARWHSTVAVCHGLAGNGEFLLDLAEAADGGARRRRYIDGAWESAALAGARCALRSGRLVLPDETGLVCGTGYGTGSAGVLAFLLRLSCGGRRLWIDPAPAAASTVSASPATASPGTAAAAEPASAAGRGQAPGHRPEVPAQRAHPPTDGPHNPATVHTR